ncbi:hypothetical protein BKA70DRAFT_762268 [Coprinopsis sp. MPI-PUGE-AT-0042]|nr:hypothetical protein BKA70DRAFT_762268 [Coprinopsis sp. MPI-PUGE-AT-0042]
MSGTDSPTFNDQDADIVFLSSDEPGPVRFHIHSTNLKVSTGAFPPLTMGAGDMVGLTVDEPVKLSEPASVLEVLFAFMYPRLHPELKDTPFEELVAIAEAVEKYQVYPAISLCKIRMGGFLREQPVEVGSWAARHGHIAILDEAAPLMISLPLVKALQVLPSHLILPWAEYYTAWEKVKKTFLYYQDPRDSDHQNIRMSKVNGEGCVSIWATISSPAIQRFRDWEDSGVGRENPFLDLDLLLASPDMKTKSCCRNAFIKWRECVKKAMDDLPKFSEVVIP